MFGAYFHQDWPLEGADWPELVDNFLKEPTAYPQLAAAEIDRLLLESPEDGMLAQAPFDDLGCNYDPRPDLGGLSIREWLMQVAKLRSREAASGIT